MLKKSRFLLLILLLIASSIYSQNIPLLDTSRVWSCWWNSSAGGGGMGGFRLKIGNIDTIDNHLVNNILFSYNEHPQEWFNTDYYLSEDTVVTIWFTGTNPVQHIILYDFTLIPGDTLHYMVCDSVDSLFIGNEYRRRLFLHCTQKSTASFGSDVWIEGLGSMESCLLFPENNCMIGSLYSNVCVSESGVTIYQNNQFADCLPFNSLFSVDNWIADNSAQWCYDYLEENPFSSDPNEGYVKISVIKDTLMQGFNCKKLVCRQFDHLGQNVRNIGFYTYFSDRKVFYTLNNYFSVLYDFGAQPGDSWTIRNPFEIYGLATVSDSLTIITVDSVSTLSYFFPFYYKRLYTHSNSAWFFNKPVMVRSGGEGFMFPGRWADWTFPYPGDLRNYTDNIMWGFSPQNQSCEALVTGISQPLSIKNGYQVINPVIHDFRILVNENAAQSGIIQLFDEYGKLLNTLDFNNQTEIIIPGKHLSPGIYFIRIVSEQKNSFCLKTLKY